MEDAQAWLDGFAERKAKGIQEAGGQQTLGTWLQVWLDHRPAHLKPTTLADYAYKLSLLESIAHVRLVDLTPDGIDIAIAAIDAVEDTRRKVRGLLIRAWNEAKRRRYVSGDNPATAERTSRPPATPIRRLNPAHTRQLITQAASFYRAAWPLMAICGLRPGEVCGLTFRAIDHENCTLHIAEQITDLRGVPTVQSPKTPASFRLIPFPRGYAPILDQYLNARTQRAALGLRRHTWQESGRVFCGKSGRFLNPTSLYHALQDDLAVCNLAPMKAHELRHTAGGHLESLDAPEHIIAGIFGHGPKVITRRYAPPSVATMRPWIEAVWALVMDESGAHQRQQRA